MATSVLGLKTFAASDPVDYNEINDNYVKIDNGVKTAMQGRAAHNLLDNSWFVNPVNQRGAVNTTQYQYCLDRWIARLTDISLSVGNSGLTITSSATANVFIYQKLSSGKALNGKTVTVAVCDGFGAVATATTALPTTNKDTWVSYNTAQTANGVFASVIDLGGGDYPLAVRVGIVSGGSNKTIKWVALYEGSYTADTLPAYVPKGYAAELEECMRYYYRSNDSNSGQDGMIIRRAINTGNSTKSFSLESVDLPVPMRITPTITVFDVYGNKNYVQEWYSNDQVGNTSIRYANNRSFCVASESGNFIGGKSYYFNYEASADL